MNKLECKESIADLWGFPNANVPKVPSTEELFKAIAGEATACLYYAGWDIRIRRIENILSVIKARIAMFQLNKNQSELESLVKKEEMVV